MQPTSSFSPAASGTSLPVSQDEDINISMWVCIPVLVLVLLVILAGVATWWFFRRRKRKPKNAVNASLSDSAEEPEAEATVESTLRRNISTGGGDERRSSVVDDSQISPLFAPSEESSNRTREDLDAWKRGFVPPLNLDDMEVPVEDEASQIMRGTIVAVLDLS
jgi:hypothetical protein